MLVFETPAEIKKNFGPPASNPYADIKAASARPTINIATPRDVKRNLASGHRFPAPFRDSTLGDYFVCPE